MKKVIRLTESDLYKIVERVLNEQTLDYDYYFSRDTGVTDLSDTNPKIYFKKNGDTYRVFAENNNGIVKEVDVTMPKITDLGLVASENNALKYNEAVGNAVYINSLITPRLDSYNKAKKGIFVGQNGIPVRAEIGVMTYPLDFFEKEGGEERKFKVGQVALLNDYFKLTDGSDRGKTINVGYEEAAKSV